MAPKFIPFEEVEALATIEQLAAMLGLDTKRSGNQLRTECPVHGGDHRTLCISPQVRSKRGSEGVFYCVKEKIGGDRIGLVAHCMELGQQDAAYFIASQFGMELAKGTVEQSTVTSREERATAPQKQEAGKQPGPFDPQTFAGKLAFSEEVSALGFTDEDAEHFQVGLHRGKLYIPLRHPDGSIAAFLDFANGKLSLPVRARWLEPAAQNVVPFGKRSA